MAKSSKILDFVPSPAVTIIPPWKVKFESGVKNIPAINCTNIHNTSEDVWNCILNGILIQNVRYIYITKKRLDALGIWEASRSGGLFSL